MEPSAEKRLPEFIDAPGYPPDRLFVSLDGVTYDEYARHRVGDERFNPINVKWKRFELSLDNDGDLQENETLFFDPDRRMFVFIRRVDD